MLSPDCQALARNTSAVPGVDDFQRAGAEKWPRAETTTILLAQIMGAVCIMKPVESGTPVACRSFRRKQLFCQAVLMALIMAPCVCKNVTPVTTGLDLVLTAVLVSNTNNLLTYTTHYLHYTYTTHYLHCSHVIDCRTAVTGAALGVKLGSEFVVRTFASSTCIVKQYDDFATAAHTASPANPGRFCDILRSSVEATDPASVQQSSEAFLARLSRSKQSSR